MTFCSSLRSLALAALVPMFGAGCDAFRATDVAHLPPGSTVPAVVVTPVGWCVIERRVRRGVRRGVATFHFGEVDGEDVAAVAMERAWKAFRVATAPIEHPEAWGKTIAVRVGLDELRRQRRDPLRLDAPVDADTLGPLDLATPHAPQSVSAFDAAADSELRSLVGQRVGTWPPTERRLAELLLDGEAETITAAAWMFRAEEEAAGGPGTMYPQKARTLLDARRRELEDLT